MHLLSIYFYLERTINPFIKDKRPTNFFFFFGFIGKENLLKKDYHMQEKTKQPKSTKRKKKGK